MKKVLLFTVLFLCMAVPANADIVGTDSFDYADGDLAGKTGGYGWDFLGVGNGQGVTPSAWENLAFDAGSIAEVVDGAVVIYNGSGWNTVKRNFSGSSEWGTGAFPASGIIYYAATMTINAEQSWLGIRAHDGGNERVKFGMPYQTVTPRYLGINNEVTGVPVYSDVLVEIDRPYRIVGVVDFDNNAARMWIDPDSGDYDTAWDHTSADVVYNDLGMTNWLNGIGLGSELQTTWDDVIAATTFGETFIPGSLEIKPHDPDPASGELGVEVDVLTLSWSLPRDPNNLAAIDPNLVSMKLYMGTDPNVLTMPFLADITSWDGGTMTASHVVTDPDLKQLDSQYFWRVDSLLDNGSTVEGDVWVFDTKLSTPEITDDPDYQVVEATTTASFSVTAESLSPMTYQWYRYVDGSNDTMLSDGGDISGSQTSTLEIANVELADEGSYYCEVNNDSGVPDVSEIAMLGVKRRIAYWPFEGNDANSVVAGSPGTILYGDPVFDTGMIGDGMSFDADAGAIDLLYTNPYEVSYFDICNYSMTVACWIKSSSAASWGPMVARNGEDGQGWQLRHNGNTLDKVCFTTRGTGNDDGTATDKTVYDGQWHFAVGTFDGTTKKIYIDGVLNVTDEVSGLVNDTESPVALAGRVKGTVGTLVFESVTACTLDDVSIYNYALDPITIAQEYADGANVSVCPENPAYDLDGDCRVDLDDFALMAGQWLVDQTVSPQ